MLNMKIPIEIEEEIKIKTPFVAIAVIFAILTFFIPLASSALDWKDFDFANELEKNLSVQ